MLHLQKCPFLTFVTSRINVNDTLTLLLALLVRFSVREDLSPLRKLPLLYVCLPDLQLPRVIFPVFLTKGGLISIYYIFIASSMLLLVIFEDDKSGNFLRGDKSFRM